MKVKKKIFWRGLDAYCPHCNRELYLPSVSTIMKKGGFCVFCGRWIDKE